MQKTRVAREYLAAADDIGSPNASNGFDFGFHVLVFLHLGSRRVYRRQPTFHPDETWVMQQARNVTLWLDDHGIEANYLIHDRDTKFLRQFDAFWWTMPAPSIRLATSPTI